MRFWSSPSITSLPFHLTFFFFLFSLIGFGEALSKKLSQSGFHVIATCLTKEGVEKLQKEVALTVLCNITNSTDITNLSHQVEQYCQKEGTKVWALVNNAGIADGGALDWTSLDVYRRVMEVNFFGLVATTKAILPFLKSSPNSRIVNLSSVAGLVSGAGIGPYFASKHAVEGLAKGLREELKPWNIHVSNVNPAFMRTPILTSGMNSAKTAFEKAPQEITSQYDRSFEEAHLQMMNRSSEDPALVIDVLVEAITDKYPVMWYFPGYGSNLLRSVLCLTFESVTTSFSLSLFLSVSDWFLSVAVVSVILFNMSLLLNFVLNQPLRLSRNIANPKEQKLICRCSQRIKLISLLESLGRGGTNEVQ
jgi:short-subunit dehydrogenase